MAIPDLDFLGVTPSGGSCTSEDKTVEPFVTKKALKAALESAVRTVDQGI